MPKPKTFIKNLKFIAPIALIAFAGACSSLRVHTDYARSADFTRFHTYSWIRVQAANQLWADRIRRDVNQQLMARGWMEVPSGGEASVAAFGATRQEASLQTFYSGFGPGFGGWYWGGFGTGVATTQTVLTPIGSLTVDIFDSSTRHLMWRGTAQQALSGNPQRNRQKLERAVARMFRDFPPRTQG